MGGTLFLVLAILCNSAANALFKVGASVEGVTLRKGLFIGTGLAIGLVNTLSFIKSLETLDLSVAYPIFCAASIVDCIDASRVERVLWRTCTAR